MRDPPRPDTTPAPSQPWTGGVSNRDPTGVPKRDPLNHTSKSPTEPRSDAMDVLTALPWKISARDANSLEPALSAALNSGWTNESLANHLSRNPHGVHYPVRLLARRLSELPEPPAPHPPAVPWCGKCEDPQSRTITVTLHGRDRSGCVLSTVQSPGNVKERTSPVDRNRGEVNYSARQCL